MVSRKRFFKTKAITLAKQAYTIEYIYPNFITEITPNGELIVYGDLKPSPISTNYKVKINYKLGKQPRVEVLNPKLRGNGKKIPHTYSQDRPCIYHPKYNEWKKSDYISDSIIPWLSLWLYYYEIWKVTGEWLGGGKHPD